MCVYLHSTLYETTTRRALPRPQTPVALSVWPKGRNFDPIGVQEFHQFVSPRFVMGCRETARINDDVWEDKDNDMMIYGDIYIYMVYGDYI